MKKLSLSKNKKILNNKASFFKEEVRREIISRFNEKKLYDSGLTIMTTIDEKFQIMAEDSFRSGLELYTNRSGWNGAIKNFKIDSNFKWNKVIADFKKPSGLYYGELAIVKKVDSKFNTSNNKKIKKN